MVEGELESQDLAAECRNRVRLRINLGEPECGEEGQRTGLWRVLRILTVSFTVDLRMKMRRYRKIPCASRAYQPIKSCPQSFAEAEELQGLKVRIPSVKGREDWILRP